MACPPQRPYSKRRLYDRLKVAGVELISGITAVIIDGIPGMDYNIHRQGVGCETR